MSFTSFTPVAFAAMKIHRRIHYVVPDTARVRARANCRSFPREFALLLDESRCFSGIQRRISRREFRVAFVPAKKKKETYYTRFSDETCADFEREMRSFPPLSAMLMKSLVFQTIYFKLSQFLAPITHPAIASVTLTPE